MLSSHVAKKLSAYCHDELPSAESRQVAEHLIGCRSCRVAYEEIKLGAKFAEQLPLVPAPESLWPEIEKALGTQSVGDANTRRPRSFLRPAFAIAAALVLLFTGALLLLRSRHPEAQPSWAVARLDGAPQIDSTRFADNGRLRIGQWLETDGNSRARIDVGDIGQVEIDPNTRVRLVATKPTEHRLELARGRMSARISAPPKLFFVNTPSGVAEDLGCAYTLDVDDYGNSLLRVTAGFVALQLRDRESIVPAGAACATRPGIGPGTPYYEDATNLFQAALAKFDFEPNNTQWSKIPTLDVLLGAARPRDAMTLWYLLARVNGNDRLRVYEKMATLAPPPKGVTREGVLRLDQEMLDSWRDALNLKDAMTIPEAIRDALGRIRSGAGRRVRSINGK